MLRFIVASLFILTCGVTPAAAQSLERAEAAYFRGNYSVAMQLMQPLAEQGDRHTQHLTGFMYDRGQGVSKDHTEAAKNVIGMFTDFFQRTITDVGAIGPDRARGGLYLLHRSSRASITNRGTGVAADHSTGPHRIS